MAIWVTSDLHLMHKKILTLGNKKFVSLEEYNDFVVEQFNSVVGKDDLVYILGDVGFTPKNSLTSQIKRLNGRKILVVGNHDQLNDTEYKNMGFISVVRHPIYYNSKIILSHFPVQEAFNNPWVINVHGHIHNGELDLPNFFNVNIDINDFKPINIKVFEEKADQLCLGTRWQPYQNEWYAQWEKKR